MAIFIGREGDFNVGEHIFANALKDYIDDRHVFYKNREVFGREFDFCLLIPEIGLLVIEVKGWREETILHVCEDGETIEIKTDEGIVSQTPWKQARGYRFALMRRIHNSTGKDPLVFSMLAYPNISKDFYRAKRLDIVSEEEFTFLSEDFGSPLDFRSKLRKAIALSRNWGHPAAFTSSLMLQVRSMFEGDIKKDDLTIESEIDKSICENKNWFLEPYSCLSYISNDEDHPQIIINNLIELYSNGTKIYLIIEDFGIANKVITEIDSLLKGKNLSRNYGKLEPIIDVCNVNTPQYQKDFQCFNFQISILNSNEKVRDFKSFDIIDGHGFDKPEMIQALRLFDELSSFNLNQYRIEHADSMKNILVRAGAGTGKTHAMISRIVFLCYKEGIWRAAVRNRFIMITFTNEAADNMKQRLKTCFQNYYLLTKNPEFIELIKQIDNMNISTIHYFAKDLVQRFGAEIGYGSEIIIKSGQFNRQEILKDVLEDYINKKISVDRNYMTKINMAIYDLRDVLLNFIAQLQNKNFSVVRIKPEQFGVMNNNFSDSPLLIHDIITQVIPEVERKYAAELVRNNALDLGSLISELNRVIKDVTRTLDQIEGQKPRYMFIDEFQDTDDVQIDTLLSICQNKDYNLFVVGDIKQCIYRFRGAEEMAFDRLEVNKAPRDWVEYTLNKNYRTDKYLLEEYQVFFGQLNADRRRLLVYDRDKDILISTISHNQGLPTTDYFKRITVTGKEARLSALMTQLKEVERNINDLLCKGENLSEEERTIAILVRENWQAEEVRKAGKIKGFSHIVTHTGGDLYQSQPAADMLVLINAMLNFDLPEYLFKLLDSNFFSVTPDRIALFQMRSKSWMQQEKPSVKQVQHLTDQLNLELQKNTENSLTWAKLLESLRIKPVLQVLRNLYQILQPWKNYSDEEWHQQFYRINVELLLEKIIETYSVDRLSVHTLKDFLHSSIVTKRQDDCRWPQQETQDINILCATVHKAKGLEYGWVIMPYCDFRIDMLKYQKLDVVMIEENIGYRLRNDSLSIQNSNFDYQRELAERMREETRILYVAMTRAIRSFTWIDTGENERQLTWQALLKGWNNNAL